MTLSARIRASRRALAANGRMPGGLHAGRHAVAVALLALGLAGLHPGAGKAQSGGDRSDGSVVLLELYTAQGCASCPPADDMMLDLAGRDDVIALALHVDYWDYIGWADTFASRAYTERQQRYARRHGHTTIYTPQVVINGTQLIEGFRVMEVMDSLAMERRRRPEVQLVLTRTEGGLQILATPTAAAVPQIALTSRRSAVAGMAANAVVGSLSMDRAGQVAEPEAHASATAALSDTGPYTLQLVRYRPMDSVDILDGENAGLSAQYANIVTSWEAIGSWDMLSSLELTVPIAGDDPAVVIVQETGQGEIIGAARLR